MYSFGKKYGFVFSKIESASGESSKQQRMENVSNTDLFPSGANCIFVPFSNIKLHT